MAPTPSNNTPRLFVDYAGNMGPRSMQFRRGSGLSLLDHLTAVGAFVSNALAPFWFNEVQVTGWRYQEAGSDITLPIDGPLVAGEVSGDQPVNDYPEFLGFSGRGVVFGKQVSLHVYGLSMEVTQNYRLTDPEGPFVGALLAAMGVLIDANAWVTVLGDRPILKDYLNAGYNAYYQRKARRS